MDSFFDIEFLDSLKTTNVLIPMSSVRLHPDSIIKAKPVVEGQKGRAAISGYPAIPAVFSASGELVKEAEPSLPGAIAILEIKHQPATETGQVFYISASTYELICEIAARLRISGYSPTKDLQLGSEFTNPQRYLQYVIGYWITDIKHFRKAYRKTKGE